MRRAPGELTEGQIARVREAIRVMEAMRARLDAELCGIEESGVHLGREKRKRFESITEELMFAAGPLYELQIRHLEALAGRGA